jgi:hypothetical protein
MSRSMVGLLAAAGAAMSALVGLVHAGIVPVMIASAGAATGLAAYLALPPQKKSLRFRYWEISEPKTRGLAALSCDNPRFRLSLSGVLRFHSFLSFRWVSCSLSRFTARVSGLLSGLALAVRPAGQVEAPGSTARRKPA